MAKHTAQVVNTAQALIFEIAYFVVIVDQVGLLGRFPNTISCLKAINFCKKLNLSFSVTEQYIGVCTVFVNSDVILIKS